MYHDVQINYSISSRMPLSDSRGAVRDGKGNQIKLFAQSVDEEQMRDLNYHPISGKKALLLLK